MFLSIYVCMYVRMGSELRVGEAADYWGLGAVLFVMLSGRYPFDGKKARGGPWDAAAAAKRFAGFG